MRDAARDTYTLTDDTGAVRVLRVGDRLVRDPGHGSLDRGEVTLIEGGFAWVRWDAGFEVAHPPGCLDGARILQEATS